MAELMIPRPEVTNDDLVRPLMQFLHDQPRPIADEAALELVEALIEFMSSSTDRSPEDILADWRARGLAK